MKKWNMSSNTKKKKIWGSCCCHDGKGTCQVAMPKYSASGWNSQICVRARDRPGRRLVKGAHR